MGFSDLENFAKMKYLGEFRGYQATEISQAYLLGCSAEEFEFHRIVNPHFKAALEGRDKQTRLANWAKQLVPAKVYAEVTRNGVTMHSLCYTHPDMAEFIVRLENGEYWRASAFAGVRFVDEIPDSGKPKNFQEASDVAKEKAFATLAAAQEIKRSQQTGIEVTATPLGAMADKAKQEWAASKTAQ